MITNLRCLISDNIIKKDVIIIGAGASGMMCAIECGKRGRSVLVLDHAEKIGKKSSFPEAEAVILRTSIHPL